MKPMILNHPMIEHKISILRNEKTSTQEFRELISEIAMILCYEALKDASIYEYDVKTPITETKGLRVNENDYAYDVNDSCTQTSDPGSARFYCA